MAAVSNKAMSSPLGDISSPAPSLRQWLYACFAALVIHGIAAAPFLSAPVDEPLITDGIGEPTEIGVSLAPVVQPPEPAPEVQPEPEPDIPVIEERATDSPPPAPPAKPREIPDLPDIRPQAVPDLWRGSGGGSVSLEEYLLLKDWLNEARSVILNELSYPPAALRESLSGSSSVIITATREGRIVNWSFRQRTGVPILDREVQRTINSIRRLPKFPDGIPYDTLNFIVPVRFVLMLDDGSIQSGDERDFVEGNASRSAQPAPEAQGLSVEALAQCAAAAAQLTTERDAIDKMRIELESEREVVERDINRYSHEGTRPPHRVERRIEDYNGKIAQYDALVNEFQQEAGAYSAQCGSGSAVWENYVVACAPYKTAGNSYCEAFGDLWLRLQAGP